MGCVMTIIFLVLILLGLVYNNDVNKLNSLLGGITTEELETTELSKDSMVRNNEILELENESSEELSNSSIGILRERMNRLEEDLINNNKKSDLKKIKESIEELNVRISGLEKDVTINNESINNISVNIKNNLENIESEVENNNNNIIKNKDRMENMKLGIEGLEDFNESIGRTYNSYQGVVFDEENENNNNYTLLGGRQNNV